MNKSFTVASLAAVLSASAGVFSFRNLLFLRLIFLIQIVTFLPLPLS